MRNAFASYLPCFDVEPVPGLFGFETPSAPDIELQPDLVDPIVEAEERAYGAGRAAAWAEFQIVRSEDAARAEEQLVEARNSWTEQESERLSKQFRLAFQDLESTVTTEVADVLSKFVAAAVRDQAVAELAAMLAKFLQAAEHGSVAISGPEDLLDALRERLGAYAASLSFVADGKADVRAVMGETIFETQLEAWRTRLSATLG